MMIDDRDPSVILHDFDLSSNWGSDNEFGSTTSLARIVGATASLSFNGSSIFVFGTITDGTTPSSTYSIDGGPAVTFTASNSSHLRYKQVFYQSPDLSAGTHSLRVTNMGDFFWLDYFFVAPSADPAITQTVTLAPTTTPAGDTTSQHSSESSKGAIAAAAVLGGILIIVLILCCFWWRRKYMCASQLSDKNSELGTTTTTASSPHDRPSAIITPFNLIPTSATHDNGTTEIMSTQILHKPGHPLNPIEYSQGSSTTSSDYSGQSRNTRASGHNQNPPAYMPNL